MKNATRIAAAFIIIVAALLIWNRYGTKNSASISTPNTPATSTIPVELNFDSSVSDGKIIVSYSSADFSMAMKPSQILAHAYIPPCGDGFVYCLYATSSAYKGTNFESAGLRIEKRADLTAERLCLNTLPEGYDAKFVTDAATSSAAYSSSRFPSMGDAGAGHYTNGSLYRLYVRASKSCYELETRIGETQFMNYPEGSIKEFTAADRDIVKSELAQILGKVTLITGETNLFAF